MILSIIQREYLALIKRQDFWSLLHVFYRGISQLLNCELFVCLCMLLIASYDFEKYFLSIEFIKCKIYICQSSRRDFILIKNLHLIISTCLASYHPPDQYRRDICPFNTQTDLFSFLLPLSWSSARFPFLSYTDRIISPLIVGEILVWYIVSEITYQLW